MNEDLLISIDNKDYSKIISKYCSIREQENIENDNDFFKLWTSNSDIYGWLRIPGTVIDYPVLQHAGNYDDSNYYLRKDLDGNYSTAGNLYSQNYYNSDFVNDGITVIYGHNMRNETMFGTLDFYIDEDGFVDSHKYMYFYTAYNSYRYRVVAVLLRPNDNIMKLYSGIKDSEGDFSDFLTDFNTGEFGEGYVEDGFLAKKDDKFLMLSTCLSDYSERMIVVAVREEMK